MEFVISSPRYNDTEEYRQQYNNLRDWMSMPSIVRDPDVATGEVRVSMHIWTAGNWTARIEHHLSNTILRWSKYPHENHGGEE